MQKDFDRQFQRAISIERGYIAQCAMLLFALGLSETEGWGKKRIERLMNWMYEEMDELFVFYGDEWTDIVQKELERKGIQFNRYWIKARDGVTGEERQPPKLTGEQEDYIRRCRETLLSDAESKELHSVWKVR